MKKYVVVFVCLLLPAIAAAQEPLPKWQLRETRDSFAINVQGQARGFSVYAIETRSGAYQVTEVTQIPGVMEQKTMMTLDSNQQPKDVLQLGKARGQETRIDIRYSSGRVKGSATVPGPQGLVSHDVDAEVPPGAVDDNLLQPLLALLPWSANASWRIPVFSAGKNNLTHLNVKVLGTESVTVPSGTFEAYRAEMRDDPVVVNVWVTKASPHRVLKIAAPGGPFELVRVN